MLRPRRDTQIPLRHRESSLPLSQIIKKQPKRAKNDLINVDQNNVDQALTVIAPKYSDEPPTFISTELPYFKANYV